MRTLRFAQLPAESLPKVAPVSMLFSNCAPLTSAPSNELQSKRQPHQFKSDWRTHTHAAVHSLPDD